MDQVMQIVGWATMGVLSTIGLILLVIAVIKYIDSVN